MMLKIMRMTIAGLTISGTLGLLFRIVAATASAAAFGLSGTGKWAGGQLPISLGPPEYIGAALALVIMLVAIAMKWNSGAVPRNVAVAVVGTIFHIPAILGESAASWASVAPSQFGVLFADSGITESMLVTTFLTLIVSSILAFIVDSSHEDSLDLRARDLDGDVVRAVVREATILKLGTLLVGLVIAVGIQITSLVFGSSLGGATSALPTAVAGLGGVAAITIGVVIYFENRTGQ